MKHAVNRLAGDATTG